jgi:hypothetical protein
LLCRADEASTEAGERDTKAARAPRAVRVRVDFIVFGVEASLRLYRSFGPWREMEGSAEEMVEEAVIDSIK